MRQIKGATDAVSRRADWFATFEDERLTEPAQEPAGVLVPLHPQTGSAGQRLNPDSECSHWFFFASHLSLPSHILVRLLLMSRRLHQRNQPDVQFEDFAGEPMVGVHDHGVRADAHDRHPPPASFCIDR